MRRDIIHSRARLADTASRGFAASSGARILWLIAKALLHCHDHRSQGKQSTIIFLPFLLPFLRISSNFLLQGLLAAPLALYHPSSYLQGNPCASPLYVARLPWLPPLKTARWFCILLSSPTPLGKYVLPPSHIDIPHSAWNHPPKPLLHSCVPVQAPK